MSDKVRIDVWLWRARFFKTRTLAAHVVEAGAVRLHRNGAAKLLSKPAEMIGPGDQLAFKAGARLVALRIEALGERRGPAPEARALYALLDENGPDSHVSSPDENEA